MTDKRAKHGDKSVCLSLRMPDDMRAKLWAVYHNKDLGRVPGKKGRRSFSDVLGEVLAEKLEEWNRLPDRPVKSADRIYPFEMFRK